MCVESRIRTIYDTLTKIGTSDHTSMTALQRETVFSKVVNTLDNLPIAKGNIHWKLRFRDYHCKQDKVGQEQF